MTIILAGVCMYTQGNGKSSQLKRKLFYLNELCRVDNLHEREGVFKFRIPESMHSVNAPGGGIRWQINFGAWDGKFFSSGESFILQVLPGSKEGE